MIRKKGMKSPDSKKKGNRGNCRSSWK